MNCCSCGCEIWVMPMNGKCPGCFKESGEEAWGPDVLLEQPLSRRDHFAMAAMTGLLSRNSPVPDVKNDGDVPKFIAKASVILADALIAELDGGAG